MHSFLRWCAETPYASLLEKSAVIYLDEMGLVAVKSYPGQKLVRSKGEAEAQTSAPSSSGHRKVAESCIDLVDAPVNFCQLVIEKFCAAQAENHCRFSRRMQTRAAVSSAHTLTDTMSGHTNGAAFRLVVGQG